MDILRLYGKRCTMAIHNSLEASVSKWRFEAHSDALHNDFCDKLNESRLAKPGQD